MGGVIIEYPRRGGERLVSFLHFRLRQVGGGKVELVCHSVNVCVCV